MENNYLVPLYLVHSYLYYVLDKPIIPDSEFDKICKALFEKWDVIDHPHKKLINKESLKAGTGYYLKYPLRVIGSAKYLLKNQNTENFTL